MRQMKGFSIKLTRVVVESFEEKNDTHAEKKTTSSKNSVVSEPIAVAGTSQQAKRRGRQPTKKTVESFTSQSDETDSDESQPNATVSISQPAKHRGGKPTKKTAKSAIPQLDEKNSDESQPNAAASTSQPAKRRGRPAKMNVERKKRALRSNSSVDDVSFETPERRTKRKKHKQPSNKLQGINSESTDDEQEMAGVKNSKNVTLRRKDLRSTDEDDSMSRIDNESMEFTHSDTSESMLVTGKMVHSTMVRDKMPLLDSIESDNDMTPLLSEEIISSEPKSQNSSPKSQNSVILLGHGPNTATQNTMDKPMEETPRNAPKSKENRRGIHCFFLLSFYFSFFDLF